jgi:hypothetical protein
MLHRPSLYLVRRTRRTELGRTGNIRKLPDAHCEIIPPLIRLFFKAPIASALSAFTNLRYLYYSHDSIFVNVVTDGIPEHAPEFARACPTLESVTAVQGIWQIEHASSRIR